MTWQAGITLLVVARTVYVLARDLLAPAVTVLGAVIAFLVMGIISRAEAFAGLSNPAPITVAALYVLARAVEKTGALQPVLNATLGEGRGIRGSVARLLAVGGAVDGLGRGHGGGVGAGLLALLVPALGQLSSIGGTPWNGARLVSTATDVTSTVAFEASTRAFET